MDPFEALPCEMRLRVLESACTWRQAVNLSHASPALLHTRVAFSASLKARCRQNEVDSIISMFPSDLLRDALAVVTFPTKEALRVKHRILKSLDLSDLDHRRRLEEERDGYLSSIREHLDKWAAKTLTYPLDDDERNRAILQGLRRLFMQLKRYMDDYITKATSPDSTFAYSRLPRWSCRHLSEHRRPSEQGETASMNPIDTSKLSKTERYRLLKAFLRFELYSKLLSSGIWDVLIEQATGTSECENRAECLPCW
ncbi:hypothetical protein HIM_06819 [Hirsutella minnesotensis 3608]|uniref:Uncharacterized protein n=1 Tax=Hirsutella minnesotensis 3608 TaxID=1043627 RepID=A0A0F7ZIH4_9HYPO|nr:hypothetical protein HIM_06819 [Hirsutella minnesotensis 3608]